MGDMLTIFVGLVCLFAVVLISLRITTDFATTPLNNTAAGANAIAKGTTALYMFDWIIPIFLFMSFMASLIAAYLIRTYPIFFIAVLLFQFVLILISTVLANIAFDIALNPELSAISNNFTKTLAMFQIYPIIAVVLTIVLGVIMYSKAPTQ